MGIRIRGISPSELLTSTLFPPSLSFSQPLPIPASAPLLARLSHSLSLYFPSMPGPAGRTWGSWELWTDRTECPPHSSLYYYIHSPHLSTITPWPWHHHGVLAYCPLAHCLLPTGTLPAAAPFITPDRTPTLTHTDAVTSYIILFHRLCTDITIAPV